MDGITPFLRHTARLVIIKIKVIREDVKGKKLMLKQGRDLVTVVFTVSRDKGLGKISLAI